MESLEFLKVGDRISILRKHLKLSQTVFAKTVGLKQRNLSFIEKNERRAEADLLERIYKEFGGSPLWLVAGAGPMIIEKPINIDQHKAVNNEYTKPPQD